MRPKSTAGLAPAPSAPAFTDLHDAYRGRVTGFFLRRGVRSQDVEDLVQSTFTAAWRAWPTFVWPADQRDAECQFTAWLFTIALHQLLKARQQAKRHAVVVPLDLQQHQRADARYVRRVTRARRGGRYLCKRVGVAETPSQRGMPPRRRW